ncbi:MAG: hypothetical protein SH850_03770 [Planctomycetaceae bacterium]|nr:hypothetical protein [Planctomycetaceae bacterium]
MNRFLKSLDGESDRSAVLITGSIVENILELKSRERLKNGSKSLIDGLFSGTGPLATFSAKIDVLHALGEFAEDLKNRLHALRRFRNLCAHTWDSFSLGDQFVTEWLHQLTDGKLEAGLIGLASEKSGIPFDRFQLKPRERFELAAAFLVLRSNHLIHGRVGDIEVDLPKPETGERLTSEIPEVTRRTT